MMKLLIFVFSVVLSQASWGQMAGGWTSVNVTNSSNLEDLAHFAAAKITEKSNSPYKLRLMEILSAETQVVAGKNYKIKMRIGATACKVTGEDADIKDCEFLKCGAVQNCNATVWSRSWLNDTRLTKYSCDKETKSC